MGICTSCYSGSKAVVPTTTVKLILVDGQLREFSSPVKVSLLVPPLEGSPQKDQCSFICNADAMDFDEYASAMSGEDELLPGQLYFELPVSWLNRRLVAEDMASLAVKAGAALMTTGSRRVTRCWFCVKRVYDPLLFSKEESEKMADSWKRRGGGGDCRSHAQHGGKGRKFIRLDMIVEE